MKFGKSLSNQIEETLPEWRDKFLSYKELKKRLKLVYPDPKGGERQIKRRRLDAVVEKEAMTEEEMDFIQLLENELEKFNTFFVENEEEYIIRLKELQDRVAEAKDHNEEMMKIRKEVVDFHGEMVLLENYSALNYTGLVKILKKYEKRTGALIRLPFIQKVLQQPFFTTDLLDMLVKECERLLEKLLPLKEQAKEAEAEAHSPSISDAPLRRPREPSEMETRESIYMKRTVSALRVLKEIRSKSSTISMFSLPPLQTSGVDDAWKSVPAVEQAAK